MFVTVLLLFSPFCVETAAVQSAVPFSGPMAKLAIPGAHRAFDPRSEDRPDSEDSPVEVPIPDDGIPPSPAILNAQGWSSATSAFWALVGESTSRPAIEAPPDPTDLSPVTPELAEILDKWEAASRETKTVKLQFVRTVYNLVFEEERVADGELLIERPDKVSLVLRSFSINNHEKSKRIGKSGRPFRIVADHAAKWIWNSNQLLMVDDELKIYERAEIPEKRVTYRFIWLFAFAFSDTVLPLLHEIPVEKLRQDYSLKLVRRDNRSIILVASPRTAALRAQFIECYIMIDPNSWQTSAVKIIDPGRNMETVYRVDSREINPVLPADSFDPDLNARGYKSVSPLKVD